VINTRYTTTPTSKISSLNCWDRISPIIKPPNTTVAASQLASDSVEYCALVNFMIGGSTNICDEVSKDFVKSSHFLNRQFMELVVPAVMQH
jgi:hypothetical protein